jgi:hypothetical protein
LHRYSRKRYRSVESRDNTFGDRSWIKSKGISDSYHSFSSKERGLRVYKCAYRERKRDVRESCQKSEVK